MAKRLFAVGDIHGCFDKFRKLIENEIQLNKSDKVILLGDYIDRGESSKEVIEYIIDLQSKGFDIIPLAGNHEVMLLDAYHNPNLLVNCIVNGGLKTLMSFGIDSLSELESKYIDFLKGLNYYYEFDKFLFVHAGFNDEISNPFDDKYSMIWNCREFYTHSLLKDKTIIHSHCPITVSACNERFKVNKQVINIDTGCVYSEMHGYGKLTAIELNSLVLFSV